MSLKDLASKKPPRGYVKRAFPWTLRETLEADEFEALIALLDNRDWSSRALSALLREEGVVASDSSIRNYRNGMYPDPDVES